MTKVSVSKVGGGLGVVLTPEILAALNVSEGDTLRVARTERGIQLTSSNSEDERQLKLAEEIMSEDREMLRKLAE